MQQVQSNEREKKSSGLMLAVAIIIISLLIYLLINEFDKQDNPQVKSGKIMQIMV